jgi:hypothetical protein
MKPIPEGADPTDPRWESAFLDLAQGLVMAGAKARIITRLVDVHVNKIRRMYRVLRDMDPPSGPVVQGSARFFARPGKHTSEAWNFQSSIFVGCYERIGEITEVRLHRGWRLLAAFSAYLSLTEKIARDTGVKRLDINHAYALLTHCGFLEAGRKSELQRADCPVCLISYLVVCTERLDQQGCPICAMNANCTRLVQQGMDSQTGNRPRNT